MTKKILVALGIVAAGIAGAVLLIATAPDIEPQRPEVPPPLVRVAPLEPRTIELQVRTHGTVSPRAETDLIPQVSGPVVWISPSLVSGGFFAAEEPLLRIDQHDYQVALERARASLERARSQHRLAEKDLQRQRDLSKRQVASASQLDDAVSTERVAGAGLREAEAVLSQAERDLERTEIRAPFPGRVRSEQVDVGQFVARGAAVASIYAIDSAEIRLPIADDELAFVDLPLWSHNGESVGGPKVRLTAHFAGAQRAWEGRVVRTEGEIDPKSRMVQVVARVDDPYGRGDDGSRVPLAVGLFVEAEIAGHEIPDAVVVPRSALREQGLLVVDRGNQVRYREVEVIRRQGGDAIIANRGLQEGDRVIASTMEAAVDGMRVRPLAAGEDAGAVTQPGGGAPQEPL